MTLATSVLFFLRAEFEVQEVTTGQTAIYRFEGFGPSPGLAAGVTFSGPWNDFTTSVPLTVRDLAGHGEIDGVSDGKGLDWTGVFLNPLRCGSIRFWNFQTGRGISMGIGAARGDFILSPLAP